MKTVVVNIIYFASAAIAGFAAAQIGLDTNFSPRMAGLTALVGVGAYLGGHMSLWRQIRKNPLTVDLILDKGGPKASGRPQKAQ